jgi:hypothetical protein
MVLPSWVKEYSTEMVLDLVTRRAINPVDSRLRRVLVSMRWETLSRTRRNSPYRSFRSCQVPVVPGHEINLALNLESMGVTSVAGFRWTP